MNNIKRGELYVIIAGICWGIIGVFTRKMSSAGFDSIQVTFLRNLVAALELFIVVIIKDKSSLKISFRDIWMFLGTGICSIAFFNVCYFKAIELTGLSIAAVLLYTAPAMVVVMSCIFFREKMNARKIIALLLAFGGCIFTTGIIGKESNVTWLGLLIGLGSGFGYALYSIFGTVATKKYNSYTISLYTFVFAAASLLPLCRLNDVAAIVVTHKGIIIPSVCLSTVSTIIPFVCYTKGLKEMEAGKASIMAFIEPLVATLCGIAVFHEKIDLTSVIGIAMIFISVVILNVKVTGEQK